MTDYFTADLHLGDPEVAFTRRFKNVDNHDKKIFDNWRDTVKPTDRVFVLGDVSTRNPKYTITHEFNMLPGEKHLVKGNCDFEAMSFYVHNFGFCEITNMRWYKDSICLVHDPFIYEAMDKKYKMLHGHVHKEYLTKPGLVNVGVDMWKMRPVKAQEVLKLLKGKR